MPGERARDDLGRRSADQDALFAVLLRHEVRFLVAGGVAVNLYGYPRGTWDVDLIPDPSADNLRRLAGALKELNAKATDAQGRELDLDLSHPESLALGNYFLTGAAGAFDLQNGPRPDLLRYRQLEERSAKVELEGHELRVIGLDDLIRMKREAGRDKDLRDIAALTEVERAAAREREGEPNG